MGSLCDSDEHPSPDDAPTWVCGSFNQRIGYPHNPVTHWRPLPAPPVPSVSGGGDQGSSAKEADTQPGASLTGLVL